MVSSGEIRICVFTGSRADYGPLVPVVRRFARDPEIELRVLASGGHLLREQGRTIDAITRDGFTVVERVEMVVAGDSPVAVAKSIGLGVLGYADALARIAPHVLCVLGDRYEALAAVVAALPTDTMIVHFGGGQLTLGSADDRIRHAISELAHVHFVFAEEDRTRLVRMGVDEEMVHNVGRINIDSELIGRLPERRWLEGRLGARLRAPSFAVTFHPVTEKPEETSQALEALLAVLGNYHHGTVVFTAPNVDHGSSAIVEAVTRFVADHPDFATFVPSLGQLGYLGLIRHCDVVIGNSSSGLLEAPVLGTPTVNIGSRQDGRARADSVFDCEGTPDGIRAAIESALTAGSRPEHCTSGVPAGEDIDRSVIEVIKRTWRDRRAASKED
ncbi:UDP-N-acetylglucosamine 2-epimerase [Amycolatopsis sp. 3B14]|uniref:UDP-N-acetylglucosamine 2-epimerase n=1 Tax=Amycolatopsis sp. 3B14 TaxID=3243600 RepID=UPI003D97B01F